MPGVLAERYTPPFCVDKVTYVDTKTNWSVTTMSCSGASAIVPSSTASHLPALHAPPTQSCPQRPQFFESVRRSAKHVEDSVPPSFAVPVSFVVGPSVDPSGPPVTPAFGSK